MTAWAGHKQRKVASRPIRIFLFPVCRSWERPVDGSSDKPGGWSIRAFVTLCRRFTTDRTTAILSLAHIRLWSPAPCRTPDPSPRQSGGGPAPGPACLAGKTHIFPAKDGQRFTMHWPTREQILAGTNSTAPMHSCGTKVLDTMLLPHGRSTEWRWICSGASLAKATSHKFKAPSKRAIRDTACRRQQE